MATSDRASFVRGRLPRVGLGLALSLGITLVATGCGGGVGDVSGKITYKGKPVVYGSVGFVGQDGIPRTARIGPDGSYTIKDVAAGEAKITVDSVLPTTQVATMGRGGRGDEKVQHPADLPKIERGERGGETAEVVDPEVAKNWIAIPKDYADITKTKLRFTLRKGPNTYDIQLD